MEQTECSETSTYKIQTPEDYAEESIQNSEHGESLKLRILRSLVFVIAHISFPYFSLSFEAETWRRKAFLALSATDKYCVRDVQMYSVRNEWTWRLKGVCNSDCTVTISAVWRNVLTFRVGNCVIDPCMCGCPCTPGHTGYYWNSICTISHNTLITLSSSIKGSSVYCAAISVLCWCVVSPRICKLTINRGTGCWYITTLNFSVVRVLSFVNLS